MGQAPLAIDAPSPGDEHRGQEECGQPQGLNQNIGHQRPRCPQEIACRGLGRAIERGVLRIVGEAGDEEGQPQQSKEQGTCLGQALADEVAAAAGQKVDP